MTNNTTHKIPAYFDDFALQAKIDHSEVYFPGDVRQAEALLKVAPEHRLTIDAEAHLAANMTGGRVSDHRDAIVSAYLEAPDREEYIARLREYQTEVARSANRFRF